MAFTRTPDLISAVYRPVLFEDTRSGMNVETIRIELYIAGIKRATMFKDVSFGAFIFQFDISALLSRFVAPFISQRTSVFQDLAGYEVTANTDVMLPYYIKTFLYMRNEENVLEEEPGTEIQSGDLFAIASAPDITDITLAQFRAATANPFKLLSRLPARIKMHVNQSAGITYLSAGTNAIRVVFLSNIMSQTVVINPGNGPGEQFVHTVSIGLRNLFSGGMALHTGTMPTAVGNFNRYRVSVGNYGGGFSRLSEEIEFTIAPACEWGHTLHWLGTMGGAEQYTFFGSYDEGVESSGTVIEVAPKYSINSTPRVNPSVAGIAKVDIQATDYIEVSEEVDFETAKYITSVLKSPQVYYERNGVYVACVVEGNARNMESRSPLVTVNLKITVGGQTTQQI